MRASGIKRPTPVSQSQDSLNNLKAAESTAAENDPIEIALQQREALGGLGNQVTDIEAQKKKMKVFRAPKLPTLKGPTLADYVSDDQPAAAKSRPATAAASKVPKPSGVRASAKQLGPGLKPVASK